MNPLLLLSVAGLIVSGVGSSAVAFRAQRTIRELHIALQQANQTIARWHERTLEGPARRPLPPSEAPTLLIGVPRSPAPATIGARHQQRNGGRR